MKKWQKIVGILAFVGIGILLGISMIEIEAIYICQDLITNDNRSIWNAQHYFYTLIFISVGLYFIAIFLFICLWRKRGKLSISDIDKLKEALQNLGIANSAFYVDDICHADSTVLFKSGNKYQIIYVDDRGVQKVIASFFEEKQACDFLVDYFKKSAVIK